MTDTEAVRQRWLTERDQLDRFGMLISSRIRQAMREAGLWANVTSRTKSIDSILKKLLLKADRTTYDSMTDIVGVRAVMRYRPEVGKASSIMENLFECAPADDKSVKLANEGVGYLSIHRDITLRATDERSAEFPAGRFRAEIQLRTLAQHLWAEMSHDTFYKSSKETLSADLKRRVNLMAGLLEVADNEFARLQNEVSELPDMFETGVLKHLEGSYFQFASERGNPELSLKVIKLLLPLYEDDSRAVGVQLDEFVATRRPTINIVFEQQRALPQPSSIFFSQPEILMLYDRLEHDPLAVRELWSAVFPETELERVALAFGISFDE